MATSIYYIAALLIALSARAELRVPIEKHSGGLDFKFDPYSPTAPTYQALRKLVEEKKPKDVDALLDLLKSKPEYAPLFQNFVFMYASRSSQRSGVTKDLPRVIAFGDRLTIAYTGNPADPKSFGRLEVVEFDPEKSDFAFHEIAYSDKEKRLVPEDNPKSCADCHGQPPRPFWESYDKWPGAYGSDHDGFAYTNHELTWFRSFMKNSSGKGRYRLLQKPESWNDMKAEGMGWPTPAVLGVYLYRLNYKRLAAKIKRLPDFDRFRFAYVGVLLCGGSIAEFVPEAARTQMEKVLGKGFSELNAQTSRLNIDNENLRLGRMNALGVSDKPFEAWDYGIGKQWGSEASLRYLTEGRGHSTRDWSLSFPPKGSTNYLFKGGYGDIEYLGLELLPELYQAAPELDLPEVKTPPDHYVDKGAAGELRKKICPALKRESLVQLKGYRVPPSTQAPDNTDH